MNLVRYLIISLCLWSASAGAFELTIYGNNHEECKNGRQAIINMAATQPPTINLAKEGMDYIESSTNAVFGVEETLPRLFGFYVTHVNILEKHEKVLTQDAANGVRNTIVFLMKQNEELSNLFRKRVLKKSANKPIPVKLLLEFQNKYFLALMNKHGKIATDLEADLPETIKELNEIEAKFKQANPKVLTSDYSDKVNEAYILYNILNRNHYMAENIKKIVKRIQADSKRPQNLTVMVGNLHLANLLDQLNADEEFTKQLGSEITSQNCLKD